MQGYPVQTQIDPLDVKNLSMVNYMFSQPQNHREYNAMTIVNLKVRPRIVKKLGPRGEIKE